MHFIKPGHLRCGSTNWSVSDTTTSNDAHGAVYPGKVRARTRNQLKLHSNVGRSIYY